MLPSHASLPSLGSQFDTAVRSRSWDWLLALRRRLNIDVEIVDDAHVPLLGPAVAPVATNMEELLAAGVPSVRLALSTTIRTRSPQAVNVGWVQAVCLPLTMGRDVAGALIVARRGADDVTPERARGELELIGFWLSNAIEAHLAGPSAAEGDLERLSSLCRVLGDTAPHGSDREIIATFAETLAVWHDLEVYGYVETAGGGFVRDVSLPGADPSHSPEVIQRALIPEGSQITRLAKPDVERLGFAAQDLVTARIGEHGHAWLVVICGAIASHEWTRLGVYMSILEQSMALAAEAATARVVAVMARQLLDDDQSADQQVRHAIDEMREALGISSAALTVTAVTGAPLVRFESDPGPGGTVDASDGRQLVIIRRDPKQYSMAMVLEWAKGHRVTPLEQRVAHTSADLVESWLRRAVRQFKDAGERRLISRSFDEVMERFARQALDGGAPVTAIVLSFGDSIFQPGITQTRVGRIREQVRAADLVGRLSDGEIGILLYDTPADSAKVVATRLQRVSRTDDHPAGHVPVAVGLASRGPGDPTPFALTQEAREALRPADEG
jgi:GGDEF domain-containing protein